MRVLAGFLAIWGLAATGAAAASREVQYAPPPDWVTPPPTSSSKPPQPGAPQHVIWQDSQVRVGDGEVQTYDAKRARVLKPEALGMGNLSATWNPATDDFIVHSLKIIRDGRVIDVLATNKFRVIDREDRLDEAMLQGDLTAVLQAPGLQVGDELEYAVTTRRREQVFTGKGYGFVNLPAGSVPGTYRMRIVWPDGEPVRWRATPDLGALAVRSERGLQTLTQELHDPSSVVTADGAPNRVNLRRLVEFTEFAGWDDVSHQMFPLYAAASRLAAGSPVKAEAAKIAAATTDPVRRAEAALRLVQDGVRYVYVGLDGGNFRPASADETWRRKFGDCKGKTVLLLALLAELGIPAEPVLVDSDDGDGLNERLPTPGLFDHVLVRARVHGRDYWLDGTRLGDRSLDRLPAPTSRWGLPLRADAVSLEAIPLETPVIPQFSRLVDIDATGGTAKPAKVRVEDVLRGPAVIELAGKMASMSAADGERAVTGYFKEQLSWIKAEHGTWRYDEDQLSLVFAVEGEGEPGWQGDEGKNRHVYLGGPLTEPPEALTRPKEQDQSAPWVTDFPEFSRWSVVLHLPPPPAKHDWYFDGGDIDEKLGGIAYSRRSRMFPDALVTSFSRRAYLPEITAEQAREIGERRAKLDTSSVVVFQARIDKVRAAEKKIAARPSAAAAAPEEDKTFEAIETAFSAGDDAAALRLVEAALRERPEDPRLFQARADLNVRADRFGDALADAEAALRLKPEDADNLLYRAWVLGKLERRDEALADIEEALRINPRDPAGASQRVTILSKMGRKEESVAAMDAWVAWDRSGIALNDRCWRRALDNQELESAERDCAAAIKLAPSAAGFWDSYALVALRSGRPGEAVSRYDKALALSPKLAVSLYGRGIAKLRAGDRAGGEADLAAAKALNVKAGEELNQAGVTP